MRGIVQTLLTLLAIYLAMGLVTVLLLLAIGGTGLPASFYFWVMIGWPKYLKILLMIL